MRDPHWDSLLTDFREAYAKYGESDCVVLIVPSTDGGASIPVKCMDCVMHFLGNARIRSEDKLVSLSFVLIGKHQEPMDAFKALVSCLANRLKLCWRLAIILYYGTTSESH